MSELARRLGVPVALLVDWENEERFATKRHHELLVSLLSGVLSRGDPPTTNCGGS